MLNYLLAPTFQFTNTAGRPLSGGAYLEVYIHGTRTKYYCASDFDGTLHPFQIPLDSLGSAVVLAEDTGSYDIYAYNRYGSLSMSRYNVKPGAGGSGMGSITSSDGSIEVTPTSTGVDLKVNGQDPSVIRATADDLDADGSFTFSALVIEGQDLSVDEHGRIRMEDGWYHYDATVKLIWESSVNDSAAVQLYTTLNSDVMDFDLSYAHDETVQLGGEMKITTGGTSFVLGVSGLPSGMTAQLVDLGIHTITGHGDAAGYEAGDGIVIDDHEISVDPDYVQEKLTAGDNITISDNVISATDTTYTAGSNVQISAENVISATDTTYTAGTGLDLDGTEFSVDTSAIQEKLTAGSNIVIEGNTISATAEPQLQANWTENDSSSVQYIQNKPQNLVQDADYVHTDNNFTDAEKSKLAGIEAGAEANVQSNWAETNTSSDSYIQNKPDLSVYATDAELSAGLATKQDTLTAGSNITITNNVISATAAPQEQSDWAETDTADVSYIKNKPGVKPVVAGNNITITEGNDSFTISATAEPQEQANWNETDSSSVQYIQNKPVIPTVDQTYDATSTNAQSGVAVASAIANNGLFEATYGTTTLAAVQNAISAHKVVYCRVSGRMAFLAYIGSNKVEFQYYRSNADGTGDSVFVYTVDSLGWSTTERPAYVQSDWSTTSSSAASYIKNKPSIPTKTSDLTNDSGFITASDIPAQVQSDWTEADTTSAAYIANKPNLALKEDVSNKAQTVIASSTTDYPSSAATAQFVNSSIATATARFLGNYSLTDLGLTYPATDSQIEAALDAYSFQSAPTNNDYVYVEIQNPQTTSVDDMVKRFKFNGTNWLYEYTLNNSSFTAAEIAAIDSGVNSTKVGNYDAHIADTTIHVTTSDKSAWNAKQDAISDLATIRSGAALGATAVQPGDLATVAVTGSYADLSGTPTVDQTYDPTSSNAQSGVAVASSVSGKQDIISDLATIRSGAALGATAVQPGELATVASTGSYTDLSDTPTVDQTYDPLSANAQSGVAVADAVSTKQDVISDLATIRSGAQAGSTAVQPGDLATVAVSGSYTDLSNTPHIPVIGTVTL